MSNPTDEDETEETSSESQLAAEIRELKHTLFDAVAKRERVPQPLFWNLFHSRLADLRREKELQRALAAILESE